MWTTFVLATALCSSFGQAEQLTFSNVRSTYWMWGPERRDDKLLPGDSYFLTFDIEGLKATADGRVRYNMAMEVTNSKGRVVYGKDPRDVEQYNALGGSRVQFFAYKDNPADQPPDTYTVKVTVTDPTTKASQSVKRTYQVVEKTFGLVSLAASYDPDRRVLASPVGVVGQRLFVSFFAVGFERDREKKQPSVVAQMRAVDENGKPTLEKPFHGEVTQFDEPAIPLSFVLLLNRPGKFTIELQATDRISRKTAKVSFPLTVLEQKTAEVSEQK